MKEKPVVIISSTSLDLQKYRTHVMDACLRAGMYPEMMDHLPAMDADAIQASLAMVGEADVYVGIIAHRYGHIPAGHEKSITQMEYERAVDLGIPRLIFLSDRTVPLTVDDIDFENKTELDAFKNRLKQERVVAFFKSPEDLRGLVIHGLSEVKKQLEAARTESTDLPAVAAIAKSLHYLSEIPQPPEEYVAHPYTLLRVRGLVGRKQEMEALTDWVTGKPQFKDVRIFNVVAIGGMGKSALTWTWFNKVAPQEMSPLAGRVWWSFYESDATFENFVTRALAYVSKRPLEEVKKRPFAEQEDLLLHLLDRNPFLIVLDGLERILTAYARLDAAYMRDEDALDDETANRVAGALGLPQSAGQSFVGKHKLRMAADPRAGRFLRDLARVRASRILISTRLYPADLQAPNGMPLPGCEALFLPGLSDQDALDLWREFGARGSRDQMLQVFRTFDKHPLLLQLLAYEVAEFRGAPGDFDAWKSANPDFNPLGMPLVQVQSHVLAQSLSGLSSAELRTLHVIAGFRMPASMETLKALLVGTSEEEDPARKPFTTLRELDAALTVLEDRGLLGWDRRANRYDLHPIVRGIVWTALGTDSRAAVYDTLRTHFEAIPPVEDALDIETLDDLTPAIELYNTLTGLKLYDDAFHIFQDRLEDAAHYRLNANHLRIELLRGLFSDENEVPQLSLENDQSFVLNALALGYNLSGNPSAAVSLYQRACEIYEQNDNYTGCSICLENMAVALFHSGRLRSAETAARTALAISRTSHDRFTEAAHLQVIGLIAAARSSVGEARAAFTRSDVIWGEIGYQLDPHRFQDRTLSYQAQANLWYGDSLAAKDFADRAAEFAGILRYKLDMIRAARLQGVAALQMRDFSTASTRLHDGLVRSRSVNLVHEELPALTSLAELHRQQGEPKQARAMLDDIWEPADRGPYPLLHADALNVLAHIERDAGNRDAAVEAATKAYRLAWCDGPPFAYHWGLETAKAHLAALGAPEPDMRPFDESQHEPMPEVEINPPDEFGGDDEPDEDEGAE